MVYNGVDGVARRRIPGPVWGRGAAGRAKERSAVARAVSASAGRLRGAAQAAEPRRCAAPPGGAGGGPRALPLPPSLPASCLASRRMQAGPCGCGRGPARVGSRRVGCRPGRRRGPRGGQGSALVPGPSRWRRDGGLGQTPALKGRADYSVWIRGWGGGDILWASRFEYRWQGPRLPSPAGPEPGRLRPQGGRGGAGAGVPESRRSFAVSARPFLALAAPPPGPAARRPSGPRRRRRRTAAGRGLRPTPQV